MYEVVMNVGNGNVGRKVVGMVTRDGKAMMLMPIVLSGS